MALNEDQLQSIRQVLVMSGWVNVMKPAIENRGRQAVRALTLSRTERTASYKGTDFDTEDDILRAMIRDSNWMIVCWDNEIAVAEYNRRADELDRQSSNGDTVTTNS